MRIVATSDLHGFLPVVPEGDVLLIGGDIMPVDDHSYAAQVTFIEGPFGEWLDAQPHEVKIGVAGNHDFLFDPKFADTEALRRYIFPDAGRHYAEMLPWTYLTNRSVKVGEFILHGTPWVPSYGPWAFMHDDADSGEIHAWIELDTNIVLSHGPPRGILDQTLEGVPAGSLTLAERLEDVGPMLVICGHIHEAYGQTSIRGTTFANVSYVDRGYDPSNPPMVFDL